MNNKDLQITFTVSQTPHEVFEAINNVSAWWNEEVIGNSRAMGDEFSVQFFVDVHYSKQLLEEVIPDRKVVWLVTDSRLSWLKDKEEWTGTRIVFEISEQDKKTQFKFTHIGLNPGVECYQDCYEGWHQYVGGSLFKLITTGKGEPEKVAING